MAEAVQTTDVKAETGIARPALRHRITLGRTGLTDRQQRRILAFRGLLEQMKAEAAGGEITPLDAMRIETATRAYGESIRAGARLAEATAGKRLMSESEIQGWSDRILKHLGTRDKAVESLGLDKSAFDPWTEFYRAGALHPAPRPSAAAANRPTPPLPAPENAAEAKPSDLHSNGICRTDNPTEQSE